MENNSPQRPKQHLKDTDYECSGLGPRRLGEIRAALVADRPLVGDQMLADIQAGLPAVEPTRSSSGSRVADVNGCLTGDSSPCASGCHLLLHADIGRDDSGETARAGSLVSGSPFPPAVGLIGRIN
jgi:hypothetical protein